MPRAVSPVATQIFVLDLPEFFNPTEPMAGFAESDPLVFEDAKQITSTQKGSSGQYQRALSGDKGTSFTLKFLSSSFEAAQWTDVVSLHGQGILRTFDMLIKFVETGSTHQLLNCSVDQATTGLSPAADASSVMSFLYMSETSLPVYVQLQR